VQTGHVLVGDELWLPSGHFFNLLALAAAGFAAISMDAFLHTATGARRELSAPLHHPPYLVPRADGRDIYAGAYYSKVLGLRWQHGPPHGKDGWRRPSRISVHGEVRQATTGRVEGEPWVEGAGHNYWAVVERAWPAQAAEVAALLEAETTLPPDAATDAAIDQLSSGLMAQHVAHISSGAVGSLNGGPRPAALDFAPSFGFFVDVLATGRDLDLARVRHALQWGPAVVEPAAKAEALIRAAAGEGGRYLAIHLRRSGYAYFCTVGGLDYYGGKRFGVTVTAEMWMPKSGAVAVASRVAADQVGTDLVFVATDVPEDDGADVRALLAAGLRPVLSSSATVPWRRLVPSWELLPMVEQSLCARADGFVGNIASTFSFAIVQERDVLGKDRGVLNFWSMDDDSSFSKWSEAY
jgi:hypothetical protein